MLIGGSRWTEQRDCRAHEFCRTILRCQSRQLSGAAISSTRCIACYAGDFGIGPNPKLLARREGRRPAAADRRSFRRNAIAELHASSIFPQPQIKLVHVHPGAEELGRVYHRASCHQCRSDRVLRRAAGLAAAEGDRLARRSQIPRTPTISPGARRRHRCRAPSISARSWSGCAKTCRRTRSSRRARAISRAGSTALSRAEIRRARRGDVWLHGLWLAGSAGDADALSRSSVVVCVVRRRRLPDDRAGFSQQPYNTTCR